MYQAYSNISTLFTWRAVLKYCVLGWLEMIWPSLLTLTLCLQACMSFISTEAYLLCTITLSYFTNSTDKCTQQICLPVHLHRSKQLGVTSKGQRLKLHLHLQLHPVRSFQPMCSPTVQSPMPGGFRICHLGLVVMATQFQVRFTQTENN